MHLKHVLKVIIGPIGPIGPIGHKDAICAINSIDGTDAILKGIDAKNVMHKNLIISLIKNNSYMDDLYPSMNSYEAKLASPAEIYLYSCILIGLLILISFIWIKEPQRYYKMKRKNTDEAPVVNV
jgi:hypothetical protein